MSHDRSAIAVANDGTSTAVQNAITAIDIFA
jgi:hypothetical protein